MILNFKKVILHNFASYSHAEVALNGKGFCFVSGRNLFKKDNSYSNGSGKSFIWSGICFTLTGETIAGQHSGLKNLLIDEDNSYTTVELAVDSDDYKITRVIAPKSDLQIIKNGTDVSGKGIRESEKKLAELLPDLNKDFIASTFIIGQGMPNAFSKFSPSGRKEILERLTNSDYMIEDVKQRVLNRLTELNTKLRGHDDALLIANTKLSDTTRLYNSADSKFKAMIKPDFDGEINELNNKVTQAEADLKTVDSSLQNTYNEAAKVDTDYTEQLTKKTAEIDKVNANYNEAVKGGYAKKTTLSTQLAQVNAEAATIRTEITKIDSIKEFCPTCGQKLLNVNKPSTTKLKEDLGAKVAEVKALNENITAVDNKIMQLGQTRSKFLANIDTEFATKLDALKITKQKYQSSIIAIQAQQTILKSDIATYKANIKTLETNKTTWDANYEALKLELVQYQATIDDLNETIKKVTEEKLDTTEHISVVKKIDTLVKRDLRGHLLANIIAYINKRAKDFSETVFGTRELSLTLAGNALDISYCGRMFDNLSGGEKMRVDLILQLAIRDMLKTYLNTHANILVLDEITDFLDKQSCAAVMKLIESELNTVESVFIISHHVDELNLPIDTELKIIKDENGISTVNC